jgi:type IV pilus assembly protein PilW
MKINKQNQLARINHSSGVSLIELLIALVIAGLLALGLVQIFGASRSTSQLQDGLSRVQENGRFVTQFMERQLRMVGFMGCGADTGRFTQESFVNHLALFDGSVPDGNPYRFQRPIEAFTAGTMTATDELAAEPIVDGTDVILRVLSDESTPSSRSPRRAMISAWSSATLALRSFRLQVTR